MIVPERKTVNPAGNPTVRDISDPQWEGFKDALKKIAAVPKEEVDEMRAEHERKRKGKR